MCLIKTTCDKMNDNGLFFFLFFSEDNKPNDTDRLLLKLCVSGSEHMLKPVLSSFTFISLHSPFRCSRCTRTNSPKTVKCWRRKQRGRNTPAIGSSGSAESVPSRNVPLYYRRNCICISIIKKHGKQMCKVHFIKCVIIFVWYLSVSPTCFWDW